MIIDANGVFHSTAQGSNVPNTYDKGVGGSVVSLLIAAVFGISAAHMLRKFR